MQVTDWPARPSFSDLTAHDLAALPDGACHLDEWLKHMGINDTTGFERSVTAAIAHHVSQGKVGHTGPYPKAAVPHLRRLIWLVHGLPVPLMQRLMACIRARDL